MGWFKTLIAALTVIVGFSSQNVAIVYWTNFPISPYGILLLCGLSFSVIFGFALFVFAALHGDWRALLISDYPEERKVFTFPFRHGRFCLTHAQILVAVGFLNSLNGWLIVYASPPDRTPPLIQAVLQNAGILFSVPFSKLALGDKKQYCGWKPMVASLLISSSVAVSLVPSILNPPSSSSSSSSSSSLSSLTSILWCLIYVAGLAPGAGYNVLQQLYFLRTGMLEPDVSIYDQVRGSLRALFWANIAQAISFLLCFWVDLLPWFGTSTNLSELYTSTAFSLACSVGGPGLSTLVNNDECSNSTALWGWVFILAYAISYVGAAVLNRESATFNMLVLVVVTMTTAAIWLIPGTNPNPVNTPLWSVLSSLGLSIIGTSIWKWWENGVMPAEEQFSVTAQDPLGDGSGLGGIQTSSSRGGVGKRGGGVGGRSFGGDSEYDEDHYYDHVSEGLLGMHGGAEETGQGNGWWNGGGISDAVLSLVHKHQTSQQQLGTLNSGGGSGFSKAGSGKYTRMTL